VNKINKRRRTGDDLLDAFLEISDIMTYNQMQPTAQHNNALFNDDIQMLDTVNISSVLPHRRHIDNSDEVDNVDNIDGLYNVNNNNEIKRRKPRRGKQKNQKSQNLRKKIKL
jgi:hypothetical protein